MEEKAKTIVGTAMFRWVSGGFAVAMLGAVAFMGTILVELGTVKKDVAVIKALFEAHDSQYRDVLKRLEGKKQ